MKRSKLELRYGLPNQQNKRMKVILPNTRKLLSSTALYSVAKPAPMVLNYHHSLLCRYSTELIGKVSTIPHEKELSANDKLERASAEFIEQAYSINHIPAAIKKLKQNGPPYTDTALLKGLNFHDHKEPKEMTDKIAYKIVHYLRHLVHYTFGSNHVHHALLLETVAAVPGMIGAMLRHFSSLRSMKTEHGKVGILMEEAENERMHLMTWMEIAQPSFIERMMVLTAQIGFTTFYTMLYILSPRLAHRLVGYLEEEACIAYTKFYHAIENGDIPNVKAPEIAIKYWNLNPETATLKDVVLAVRADEAMHRNFNHQLSDKLKYNMNY